LTSSICCQEGLLIMLIIHIYIHLFLKQEIVAICLDGFHDAVAGVKLASISDMENGTLGESNAAVSN